MNELQYPIGEYDWPSGVSSEEVGTWIEEIKSTPTRLREAVSGLDDAQLDTRYRPKGWTLRQVVHHLADSHMNSYIRFKLALTEDSPEIRPYHEERWAELPEAKSGDVEISLQLLDAIHARWGIVLEGMGDSELARTLRHPDLGELRLDVNIGLYAWHGNHHIAHILTTRERESW